jgi:hypothetical protein
MRQPLVQDARLIKCSTLEFISSKYLIRRPARVGNQAKQYRASTTHFEAAKGGDNMTTINDPCPVSSAAERIGEAEVFEAQITTMASMLRAMYMAHPAPERVRHYFDQLIAQLLSSPYVSGDPDRQAILQDAAESLTRRMPAAEAG